MKIDFLVDSLVPGGAERVAALLADHFEERGNDITLITFNEPEVWKVSDAVKRVRLHDGNIKNQMIRSTQVLGKYYYKKNRRPDVLITFMTRTNLIGILIARLYGIKVIACEHINHVLQADKIERFTRKYVYRHSDALTCLTSFDQTYYKGLKANVYVMPNPCTFEIFNETHRKRDQIILAVGALDRYHHKGFDNLIPIIAPVLKKHSDWKLRIVGGGSKGKKLLTDLTIKHQIEDQVIFHGFSNEVSKIMQQSEIYIMPSRFEGLPMVLIEALSQGVACISFDCVTGPSDIIEDNVNGLLIEDQNLDAMTVALEELISNPEKRQQLATNGINSLDQFKIESIYDKYMAIIESFK